MRDCSRNETPTTPIAMSSAGARFATRGVKILGRSGVISTATLRELACLDAFFERFLQGIEFVGSPQRRVINANWKLPVENQLGDVNHGPFLHAAVIPPDANEEVFKLGYSCVTEPGHGATFRLMPEDAPLESVA